MSKPLITVLLSFADRLKFRNLFLLVLSLLLIDLFVPDFIPFIDEILLGLAAIILANWRKDRDEKNKDGNLIEGEVIDEKNQK